MTGAGPVHRRAWSVAGLGTLALVTLAACTSGGGSTPSSTPPSASTSADTTAPTDTPSSTASTPPSSTPPTTTAPPPSSAPPPTAPTCAKLDVGVTRVPGAAGVTYGLVTVTSREAATCALPGVPSLRLLDSGRTPVTQAATAIPVSGAVTTLAPGGTASTLLQDRSDTCQADSRSAFVEVKATTAAATVVAALALPPCSLSVKPFTPGTQPAP